MSVRTASRGASAACWAPSIPLPPTLHPPPWRGSPDRKAYLLSAQRAGWLKSFRFQPSPKESPSMMASFNAIIEGDSLGLLPSSRGRGRGSSKPLPSTSSCPSVQGSSGAGGEGRATACGSLRSGNWRWEGARWAPATLDEPTRSFSRLFPSTTRTRPVAFDRRIDARVDGWTEG